MLEQKICIPSVNISLVYKKVLFHQNSKGYDRLSNHGIFQNFTREKGFHQLRFMNCFIVFPFEFSLLNLFCSQYIYWLASQDEKIDVRSLVTDTLWYIYISLLSSFWVAIAKGRISSLCLIYTSTPIFRIWCFILIKDTCHYQLETKHQLCLGLFKVVSMRSRPSFVMGGSSKLASGLVRVAVKFGHANLLTIKPPLDYFW